ncbi:ATP/maltotriose-dependent transcriptional regulator MalT/DNA-binding SARP family transcriptional activator [Solibacillus kalamii]|uniref:Transcriptional regulator n=1 Tax=Solibacillus kalamii TaxID=1748298 RepID=A0ABX3ZHR9_9BACL|nr:BTAD domain-containing putative transcriptional regulator [Solibacillus kalamii]MBM7665456.1 ATP/maltotriose-dependent transcriptional regulator MalT/DNA-binding SARP family transcriptional activator [Solibacillus kalamii]OUZ39282.1 transcriptional regulator [Solibacillus kalamii]
MEQHIFVSKLIPPTPVNNYLRRAKLMKKLSDWPHAKCTILHSSAGYGKTSLMSQFLNDQKTKSSWYQITPDDDSIFPFLRHFIYSIQQHFPSFGDKLKGWDETLKFHNMEELLQLSKQIANELHYIKEPFLIVLDDYHHVSHVFPINYIMNQLLQFLPANLHIIVATRKMPEWSCLLTLRMNNQLIECLEPEFTFAEEDVQYLFEAFFDRQLTDEQSEFIMQMTEGWAMAIMLLGYKAKYSQEQLIDIAEGSVGNFFAYLSAEVFDKLDEQLRLQLLKLGIHQVISLDVITELYGVEWIQQVKPKLDELAFITPLAGGTKYRFHALFQQFLQQRLSEYYPDLHEESHGQAARYYANQNLGVLAVTHATQLKNNRYYIELLLQFSPQFIEAGQFEFLLERLKDFAMEEKPYQLLYYEGECQRYRAQYERAKNAYNECFIKAQLQQDRLFLMRSQFGLANIYLDTLQPVFAEHHLQQAISLLNEVDVSDTERHLINSLYTENLINLGKAGEALRWSQSQNLELSINNIDARLYLRHGQLEKAKELLNARVSKPFQWEEAHRTTDLLLVLIDVLMGENTQAYSRIIEGGKEALVDMPYTLALTKLRKGLALLNMEMKDFERAKGCFDETLDLLNLIHVKRITAECYMGLILYHRDNVYEAKRHAQIGLRETNKVQDFWMSALLLTALTKVLAENSHFQEAVDTAKQALSYYERSEDTYGQMICFFWLAYCFVNLNNQQEALTYYRRFWDLCVNDYPFFMEKKTLFGPRYLIVFVQLAKQLQQEMLVFNQLNINAAPSTELSLTLFGPVQVYREHEMIQDKEWKRLKAKELFFYLYIHREQFVSRQQICDAIWQQDEEAMQRDFKVVFNAMLKTLEPTRSAREESNFIKRHQHLYKLEDRWIHSDVAYFTYYVQRGLEEKTAKLSNEWLKLAMRLVDGPFCSDMERDWLESFQAYYNEKILLILERVAQNYVRLQQFEKVIRWADRIIALDDGHEEGYRLLMLAHYYLGNRREAIKHYERCVDVLDDQYKITPMEPTERLYELVLKM